MSLEMNPFKYLKFPSLVNKLILIYQGSRDLHYILEKRFPVNRSREDPWCILEQSGSNNHPTQG